MDKSNLLIISCIFGNKFLKVYPAPLLDNCYFFSNNNYLKDVVESKGWKFIFINFKLNDCSIISSLQSKYIKFLIFLNDLPLFKKYEYILYFDHKVFIKENHIDKLLDNDNKYNIIIRKHEAYRKTIWSEVEEAKLQERYNKNMDKTIKLINDKINKKEISENVDICNTGLILYNNYNEILPMLYDIYNTCISLEQPECQIIWAIFSQNYLDKIKLIDFYNIIDPIWMEPSQNVTNNNDNIYFVIIILILFILILKN
jgi:hypothetical protein